MKKAIVLLLALAMVGTAFAQVAPTLAGSGTLTFTYDANTEAHGFTNSYTSSITLPLVASASASKKGEGVTGSITLADYKVELKDSVGTDTITITSGSVTAKILFGDMYLQVYGKPSMDINYAKSFAPWVADAFDDSNGVVKYAPDWETGGFIFGGTAADLTYALKVASHQHAAVAAVAATSTTTYVTKVATAAITVSAADVTATKYYDMAGAVIPAGTIAIGTMYVEKVVTTGTATTAADAVNEYGIGADASYSLGDLGSVAMKLAYGPFGDAAEIAFGVKASLTLGGLGLVVATDATVINEITGLDVMGTVSYKLENLISLSGGAYFGKANLDLDATRLDVQARLGVLAVENLTLNMGVDLWDLMADPAKDPMLIQVGFDGSYKVALSETTYVKPFAAGGYCLNDEVMALSVGAEAVLFPQTTFTAKFKAGTLKTDNVIGGTNAFDADKGVFTFVTKVSY